MSAVDLRDRYSRHVLFGPVGREGQKKIRAARILVIGCGALGTNIANLCARAGVGFMRIVDPDIVEMSNLHRQVLYDEKDADDNIPKVLAAERRLRQINGEVEIEPVIERVDPQNIERLMKGTDLVMDGTDNPKTRYLINDACVKHSVPWVYGGAIGASGASMAFVPGGPCLACVWPDPPDPDSVLTCDVAGVLNTAPALVAAVQVTEAIKIFIGAPTRPTLWQIELWEGQIASVTVKKNKKCPVCSKGEYRHLHAL